MHIVSFSGVQELTASLEPQPVHTLQAALLASSEKVPVSHGIHLPDNFTGHFVPHGGVGSSPAGHFGQEMQLNLLLLSSRMV